MKISLFFKTYFGILLFLSSFALFSCDNEDNAVLYSLPLIPDDSVKVTKIWDNKMFCSFTSLVKYQGEYYCAFRESISHLEGNGSIRILKSSDARDWKEAYYLSLSGCDLRDPNLSVMPDGRLMLICGRQTVRETQTVVSFLPSKDADFSAFQEIKINEALGKSNWIWHATWFDDVCYGVRYGANYTDLLKTNDGINWIYVSTIARGASEVHLGRMSNGDMVALARTNGKGLVCYSSFPYKSWDVQQSNIILEGQYFVVTANDRIICVSRSYYNGMKTTLYCNVTNKTFSKLYDMPSGGGDTSYAGIILEDDRLLVSYYSSHLSPSDVFLAEIPVKCLIDRGIW